MASIDNGLMNQAVDRLRLAPAVIADLSSIRRDHRTTVTREKAPALHVVDGDLKRQAKGACALCKKHWMLVLFVRDDQGFDSADPIRLAAIARLRPTTSSNFGMGVSLHPGDTRFVSEVADGDALRVEMDFFFEFTTSLWDVDTLVA